MDKELLRKAFEAGEEYNKEKGFCEPDENFDEWYENKVKNLGVLADVSGSLLATEVDPVEKWDNGAPMYICPNCKEAELGHGDKYCPNCGQSEQLVCQCKEPDIWMKVYEGLMCLNCMKPPKAK